MASICQQPSARIRSDPGRVSSLDRLDDPIAFVACDDFDIPEDIQHFLLGTRRALLLLDDHSQRATRQEMRVCFRQDAMDDLFPGADWRIADDCSELPSFGYLIVGIRFVDFHIADVVGFRISACQRHSPLVYVHHLHQSGRISMRERKPHRTVTAADIQDIPGHFLIQAEAFDQ